MKILKTLFFVSCYLFILIFHGHAANINRIEVHGVDGKIDRSSVMFFIGSKSNTTFNAEQVASDVKTLEASGRFSIVNVEVEREREEVVLLFYVKAKPRLRNIYVNNNRYMPKNRIKKILGYNRGDTIDSTELGVRIQELKNKYNDRFFPDTTATFGMDKVANSSFVDLYINVNEGERAKVKKILFEGVSALKSKKIKKIMAQKTTRMWPLSIFSGRGTYDPELLETDLLAIRDLYRDKGYLDVQVNESEITQYKPGKLSILIPIEEGFLHIIDQIDIEGFSAIKRSDIEPLIKLKTGQVAKIKDIEQSRERIREFYGTRGFLGSRVIYNLSLSKIPEVVNVKFKVQEGKISHIRNVEIRGNTRTKDKVIRRELVVYPGDVLNEKKVRTSTERVRNTGLFGNVNHTLEPAKDDDTYDVLFDVEEKYTGQFQAGVGFSSIERLLGFVELSQGNFDIFGWPKPIGGGQKIRLNMQIGDKSSAYVLSFVEPYFLDRRLSLGLDAFRRESSYFSDDYDQRNTGGTISLAKPLSSFWRARLAYTLESIEIFNISDLASSDVQLEKGSNTRSSMDLSFTHDSRDKFYVPTRGNRSSISGSLVGGPLGFDEDIYSLQLKSSVFAPLWLGHIFNLRGRIRTVNDYGSSTNVPIFDRLYLGGPRTVRGFGYRDVSPKDERGEPIGGKSSMFGTAEYQIPFFETFRLVAFYDAGVVNKKDFNFNTKNYNTSYGIGFRLDMPGFPLQLDYAWPHETDPTNDRASGRFNFNIGYNF